MWSRRLAALVSLVAVVASGCTESGPGPSPAGPVTIGVLVTSADESDAASGGELAAELVNESYPDIDLPLAVSVGLPSLGGAELHVEVSETEGDPDAAEAATDRLLSGGQVAGIVAADRADVVAVAAGYATRRGVPTLDTATSAGYLLDLGLESYFRAGPTDRMLAEAAFALLATEPPGNGRAVVLTPASESGAGTTGDVPGLARAAGLTVSDTISTGGASDFDAAVPLAEAAPDVVIAVADTGQGAQQIQEMLGSLDSPLPVVELGTGYTELPNGLTGAVRPVGWSQEFTTRHPLAAVVGGLYEERYGRPMTGPAAAGFTGVMTLAAAVEVAGSGESADVRVALRQLDVPATELVMPWRGVQFRASGQNGSAAVVVEQYTGQGWQVVFPPVLAVAPVEWPSPPGEETGL